MYFGVYIPCCPSLPFVQIFLAVVCCSTLLVVPDQSVREHLTLLLVLLHPDGHRADELTSMARRRRRCHHGPEEPPDLLLANGPKGLDAAGAEELDGADPVGGGRGVTGFSGGWTGDVDSSADGSMAAAAFLLSDVKRRQWQNDLYTPKYIYLVDKSE
jgi:hypothetical protein